VREDVQMKLTVVGCSPAWPNPGGAQSGYLVSGPGRLLLDCGPGVLARLREREPWPEVDAIAITHFHLDHWGDLVPWAFGAMFGPGRDAKRPELWLPPGGEEILRGFAQRLGVAEMWDVFELREYANATAFHAAGLEVLPLKVPHYELLTFGMRVSNGTKSLAYSGDSAPSPQLAEVGRDADLFLCEATLKEGREGPDGLRGHLSAEEAVAAFEASGARRLLLTHRPRELPLADGLEQAHDGMVVEV
jgi:ribonuclease BN (tRNA processing enzyme)